MSCENCPLKNQTRVEPSSNLNAKMMLVGEAPAGEECRKGKYFVGSSGRRLNSFLKEVGIDREELFITNAMRCQLDDKNNINKAVKCCHENLVADIKRVKPSVIVALGVPAVQSLLGFRSMKNYRGKVYSLGDMLVVPTYHPAACLHGRWDWTKLIVQDLQLAKRIINGESTRKVGYYYAYPLNKIKEAIDYLKKFDTISLDTETTSKELDGEIISVQMSGKEREGFFIPLIGYKGAVKWEDNSEVIKLVKDILEDSDIAKVLSGAKFDIHYLRKYGIDVKGYIWDTVLMHHLIDENLPHGLKTLGRIYTSVNFRDDEVLKCAEKGNFLDVPTPLLCHYACADADSTIDLFKNTLYSELKRQNLLEIYDTIIEPSIRVLADIEERGVLVDQEFYEKLSIDNQKKLEKLEKKVQDFVAESRKGKIHTVRVLVISQLAELKKKIDGEEKKNFRPSDDKDKIKELKKEYRWLQKEWMKQEKPFNIRSSKQLSEFLFNDLKLKPYKKTKGGKAWSTDEDSLNHMKHPFTFLVIKQRELGKLCSTYLGEKGLKRFIREDGRIHTSYLLFGATNGRLSSTSPNLQNQPRSNRIRECFVVPKGWKLLSGDFSQSELHIAAMLSGDEELATDLQEEDFHSETGWSMGICKRGKELTKSQRNNAKAIMFGGFLYGGMPENIARGLGLNPRTVRKYVDKLHQKYRVCHNYLEDIQFKILGGECVLENAFGRKRHFYGIEWIEDQKQLAATQRSAANFPISSSSSDALLKAQIRIHKRLKDGNFRAGQIISLHDEALFEVPDEEIEEVAFIVKEEMQRYIPELEYSPKVEIEVSERWNGKVIKTY